MGLKNTEQLINLLLNVFFLFCSCTARRGFPQASMSVEKELAMRDPSRFSQSGQSKLWVMFYWPINMYNHHLSHDPMIRLEEYLCSSYCVCQCPVSTNWAVFYVNTGTSFLFAAWLDLSLIMHLTHVHLVSTSAEAHFSQQNPKSFICNPLNAVHDHRQSPQGCCPTLILAPLSLYFSRWATIAFGSVPVCLPPRAAMQLSKLQPVVASVIQRPMHGRPLCTWQIISKLATLLAARPLRWRLSCRLLYSRRSSPLNRIRSKATNSREALSWWRQKLQNRIFDTIFHLRAANVLLGEKVFHVTWWTQSDTWTCKRKALQKSTLNCCSLLMNDSWVETGREFCCAFKYSKQAFQQIN